MNGCHIKNKILSQSRQETIKNEWLMKRLDILLPVLMKETGIDMWVIISKEFNDDPIGKTFYPAQTISPSRLFGLVFYLREDNTVERMNLYSDKGSSMVSFYKPSWKTDQETQWECLKRLIDERKPKNIGLNYSNISTLADGITHGMYMNVINSIGPENAEHVVSAEVLGIRWLETRIREELVAYDGINTILDAIINEMFSSDTIIPGVTTTTDVEWKFIETIQGLGLRINFRPDVDLQRPGDNNPKISGTTIMPGDLLRVDTGLEYLGLHTDTQKLAYVCKNGEKVVPHGLRKAWETSLRFQDIFCKRLNKGNSGNQVLLDSLSDAKHENIDACLYTHPIGCYVHSAGPLIGLTDQQTAIPLIGDLLVSDNTCYALELYTISYVPEWKQNVAMFSEQLIAYYEDAVHYIGNRQEELILVK